MTARSMLLVGTALLLVSCAGVVPPPRGNTLAASPAGAPSATPRPVPTDAVVEVDQAIKQSIPESWPRLVLGSVPAGMVGHTTIRAGWYTIAYVDDLHTKQIGLTDTFGVNPPPQGQNGASAVRQFRGARSTYVVYDDTAPASQRYMLWDEPGTWPMSADGMRVNEFFLWSSGLTESEFFQSADSVRAIA